MKTMLPRIEHIYLSTACLHGIHDYCSSLFALQGVRKKPKECKWCNAGCICSCHEENNGNNGNSA